MTSKTNISLGYVHMESYKNGGRIFPDWFYENDDGGDPEWFEEHQKEVKDNPPEETVLKPNKTFKLKISYPLTNPFVTELKTGTKGLTRRQVIEFVTKCYKKIYKEEDKSTKVKSGNIPGMYNRNETDGKYGIWGHDLGDLMLHTLCVKGDLLEVHCDS